MQNPLFNLSAHPCVNRKSLLLFGLLVCLLPWMTRTGYAQSTGVLYEAEPPADASYVRLVHLARQDPLDVLVDGKLHQASLPDAQLGDYMILKAGKHQISLRAHGPEKNSAKPYATYQLELRPARAITLAFVNDQSAPQVFEDKSNSNRLKAGLTVYHLATQAGVLNINTADGKTQVFPALQAGSSKHLAVNPIKIALAICKAESSVGNTSNCPSQGAGQAQVTLTMEAAENYSLLLTTDSKAKLKASVFKNTLEPRSVK